ncbi:hypothetical protein LSH36_377g03024 [Paralvinella palmiformis]|uniref:Uncharacterized protein n=1 Tax=Paralvinella palmiformis TaxID=53620 RepID=A0AAD9JDB4_9ANNE|nr:hypothetical protein LSH36_377g03024 [Paralvinella palmiformis]
MDNQEGDDRDVTEHVVMLVGMRAATSTNDVIEEGVSANHKIGRVRYRILRTLALFSAFIMLGATQSILGPSLISMGVLLNEDIHTMTTSLTALSLGYLTGAALCGALYDLLNRELLFLLGTATIGISTVMAPSGDYLYLYVMALASLGFFSGGVDTAGQAYVIHLWCRHPYQWVMMLTLHFLWASGSALGPLMIRPFLIDINKRVDEVSNMDYKPCAQNYTPSFALDENCTDWEYSWELRERVAVVQYGFMAVGATSIVPVLMFSTTYFLLGPSIQLKERLAPNARQAKKPMQRRPKCALVAFLVTLFFLYNFVNANMATFLATFAVGGLHWPNNDGALLTSLYFGANCFGKLLFVYPVLRLKPEMLNLSEMLTVLCGCLLMFFSSWHVSVLWIATAMVGLGMSSINAACFFWADSHLTVSGKLSSVVMTSGSVGAMVAPVLSGYLFDRYGGLAYVIAVSTGSIFQLLVFVCAELFSTKCAKSKTSKENGKVFLADDEQLETA